MVRSTADNGGSPPGKNRRAACPRAMRLALVALLGLALGYGCAGYVLPQWDRARMLAAVFEDVCVPLGLNQPLQGHWDADYAVHIITDDTTRYMHLKSASFLVLSPQSCSIEVHEPFALRRLAAHFLQSRISRQVKIHFPELEHDPGFQLGPGLSNAWLTGEPFTYERWGVTAYWTPPYLGNGSTRVGLTQPPE